MTQGSRAAQNDGLAVYGGVTCGSLLGILTANIAPFEVGALIDQLHFGDKSVGLLVTIELMMVSVVSLLSTAVLSRIRLSHFAVFGLSISLAGQVATLVATKYLSMLISRATAGAGLGMIYAAANAAGGRSQNPARLFAISTAASLAVLTLLLPLLTVANDRIGYRGLYAVVVLLSILMFPALIGLESEQIRVNDPCFKSRVSTVRIAHLLVVLAIFNLGTGAVWSAFERSGVRLGINGETLGRLAGLSACAGIAGALLVAWLSGRVARTVPLAVGLAAAATACYLIAFAPGTTLFIVGSIIYWISYMFIYPYLIAVASAFDDSGKAAAVAAGTLMTSYALGPLAAAIFESPGTLAVFGVTCCALSMVALVPLTLRIDREGAIRD